MEFKEILQKLKYSDQFNRNLLTKEIIANIQYIHRTELLCILEILHSSTDMEFQTKLLSILSVSLVCNMKPRSQQYLLTLINEVHICKENLIAQEKRNVRKVDSKISTNKNRDIVIKWPSLYETLYIILSRGLPMKTAVTLNFIETLLYMDDDTGSRSRTLTLHAQNMIRSCGCLTAMTNLFTNYMTHANTWKALCRCVAEVCRGSEMNQTFCSHLVPLCIQRCLRGNVDVLPVLYSLLHNHKRNTDLFLEADGMAVFNRKDFLRIETCLELLTTIIQNTETETLRLLTKQWTLEENLQSLIKLEGPDSRVGQWARITLFYFESKLVKRRKPTITKENIRNSDKETVFNMQDINIDETQILFNNIMTEIISYRNKNDCHNPWKRLSKIPVRFFKEKDFSQQILKEMQNNNKSNFNEEQPFLQKPNTLCNEQLSFSFLIQDNLKLDETNITEIKQREHKMEKSFNDSSIYRKQLNYSELRDNLKSLNSNNETFTDFKPTINSTPIKAGLKRYSFSFHKSRALETTAKEIRNRRGWKNRKIKANVARLTRSPKKDVKQRSMSSRLLNAINESCTTFIKSVKSVFIGNKISNDQGSDSLNVNSNIFPNEQPYCSYSFTKYMKKREAEMAKQINTSLSTEISTQSVINSCKTCDDTLLLKQKLTNDDQLKLTIKKLKLGINLYGCDFKKISKTMWPRESYMTPNILYSLYRKLILK